VSNSSPDVLHVHEWQTAAVPMLFWENYAPAMQAARLIFTIHNLDSQGECRQEEFAATGVLPPPPPTTTEPSHHRRISPCRLFLA